MSDPLTSLGRNVHEERSMKIPAESPDSPERFALDLTALRTQAGRSIRHVHRLTAIPVATLGDYFSGRHLPPANRPEVLRKVLAACELSEDQMDAWWARLVSLHEARRRVVARTPYPGLRPFELEDADLYFGRASLLDQLLEQVHQAAQESPDSAGSRVVCLVGPSGSGKSSLLRAGLQASLGPTVCTWGTPVELDPLAPELPDDDSSDDPSATDAPSGAGPSVRAALIIDQVEELWTHPGLEGSDLLERAQAWVQERPGRVLILGLRADFYGEALGHHLLRRALQHRQVVVGPMDPEAMRAVIEGPAMQVGLPIEPGLVEVILSDIRVDHPDTAGSVLPHLAHVLGTMWASSNRRALTIADYRRAGGFEGAIRQSAEEAWAALSEPDQELARALLLRMVTSTGGPGWTRRSAPLAELTGVHPQSQQVLAHLVSRRLVTVRATDATLSHESLILAWPRLREWARERAGDLARRDALERASEEWEASGRSEDHLLHGTRLAAVLEWLAGGHLVTGLHREYVAASRALAARISADRERALRRQRALFATVVVLALISTMTSVVAFSSYRQVSVERDQAESRQLAIASINVRERNPGLSQQLAVAAHLAADTREGRSALLDATTGPFLTDWEGPEDTVLERASGLPGSEVLVLAGPAGGIVIAEPREPEAGALPWQVLAHLPEPGGHASAVLSRIVAHPDLPLVAISGHSGEEEPRPLLLLVDLSSRRQPSQTTLHLPSIPTAVAFADAGQLLLVVDQEGMMHRFGAQPDGRWEDLGQPVRVGGLTEALATDGQGRMVAAALSDGLVRTWTVAGTEVIESGEHDLGLGLFDLTVAQDGSALAAVGRSGQVHWLAVDEDGPHPLQEIHVSDTNLFAVHADHRTGMLATAGWDGVVALWQLEAGEPLAEVLTVRVPTPEPVLGLTVVGQRWVFTTLGGTTYTWDPAGPLLPRLNGNILIVDSAAQAPALLTTTGAPAGALFIWDVSNPHAPSLRHTLPPPDGTSSTGAGAISQDGSWAAMGTVDGGLVVWSLDGEEPRLVIQEEWGGRGVIFVLFSPTLDHVLAFGRDGEIFRVALTGQEAGQIVDRVTLSAATLSAAISAEGVLVVSDDTGQVSFLPEADLQAVRHVMQLGANVYGLDFSPTEDLLMMATADSQVLRYDVSDPWDPRVAGPPLTGPAAINNSVKFAPDGQRIAVAVTEGQVWVYSKSGTDWEASEVLGAGLENLQDVAWSADGTVLLGGALAGQSRLWHTDVTAAVEQICAGIGHPVDVAEWTGLLPGITYDPPCVER